MNSLILPNLMQLILLLPVGLSLIFDLVVENIEIFLWGGDFSFILSRSQNCNWKFTSSDKRFLISFFFLQGEIFLAGAFIYESLFDLIETQIHLSVVGVDHGWHFHIFWLESSQPGNIELWTFSWIKRICIRIFFNVIW